MAGLLFPPGDKYEGMIRFLHPGYRYHNVLFTLPALDNGGIHYGTALTFCGIVAGNSFANAFFATSLDGEPVKAEWDSILTERSYYFFAGPDRASKYRIYTRFDEWPFPPELPLEWQNYHIPTIAYKHSLFGVYPQPDERDKSCRVTATPEGCKSAHLVPASESVWFGSNEMAKYLDDALPQTVDHPENCIFLRRDLRHLMEQRMWLPVLKGGNLVVCSICHGGGQWARSHFLAMHHNQILQSLRGVSKECMFARIAWAILQLTPKFVELTICEGVPTNADETSMRWQLYENFPGAKERAAELAEEKKARSAASRAAHNDERLRTKDSKLR